LWLKKLVLFFHSNIEDFLKTKRLIYLIYYLFNPHFFNIFLITMPTCDERMWLIENYKMLGGVNACVNNWPFDSAAPDKSTGSRIISRFK
jgi:hypothetical protein